MHSNEVHVHLNLLFISPYNILRWNKIFGIYTENSCKFRFGPHRFAIDTAFHKVVLNLSLHSLYKVIYT
jgi:hypothetical protein